MSLHAKIVAWFVFFASMILTLFVLGDYFQSTSALGFALDTRAREIADRLSAELDRRYERAETELLGLGYAVAARTPDPAASLEAPFRYAFIRVFDDDSLLWQSQPGTYAVEPQGCGVGDVAFTIPFRDWSERDLVIEAAMPTAHFFQELDAPRFGRAGITSVMQSGTGTLVFDEGCALRSALVPATLERVIAEHVRDGERNGAARVRTIDLDNIEGPRRALAIARTDKQPWSVVVGVDHDEFAAPFVAMRTRYLAVMVIVLVGALLLVLRAIRNDMQRLHAISHAAHAIGHGRFDVWLPPPTGDEVGRVSLALGRMVDRLAATMRQMEVTRAMVAVGEMATYLSHEIRNPLSSIRLNLQMLRRDLATGTVPEDGTELVALCLTELQRLDEVVKTVLEVGRPVESRPHGAACSAHTVVQDTLRVLQAKFAAQGVRIETRLAADDDVVVIGAPQLKSILINLLLNSVEALGTSAEKKVTVSTDLFDAQDGELAFELRISDTGPGVPAHLRERIFEPFFTTKEHGNGIGLATILRLMQDCGGVIRCEPTVWAGGAEFVLEIPLADAPAAPAERRLAVAAV